jgi:hypothetical protein
MWELIRAVHLLAMAFFVGGQLLLAAAVVPVERSTPDPQRMRAMARRFGRGTSPLSRCYWPPALRWRPSFISGVRACCT